MTDCLTVESAFGITRLILNRPDQRNSLSPELVGALLDAFRQIGSNDTTRVIELTGSGDRAFCAGGDLSGQGLFSGDSQLSSHYGRTQFLDLFRAMRRVGRPVVGVLQGHALGGGFGLAMACDLVIAADDVQVGTPEIQVGLFPMIIMAVLSRNVPRKKLMEMILTGNRVSAEEAHRWGFINEVVPRADLRARADALLQSLASKSPAVLRLGRDAFFALEGMDFNAQLEYLNSQLTLNLMTEDAREGLTAFVQKRPPEWTGR